MEVKSDDTPVQKFFLERKNIAIRLLYTIFFGFCLGILQSLIFLLATVQFIWLFIKKEPLLQVRKISDRIAVLVYRMMRFISLTENTRPFPFKEFPESEDVFEEPDFEN